MAIVFNAIATPPRAPAVFGIPVDFVLFGLTLLGVAVFHHHTMRGGARRFGDDLDL